MSKHGNERDLEIGETLKFLKEHKDIKSTLDVGATGSFAMYAKQVKDLVVEAYGVDIVDDEQTSEILDGFYVGNVQALHPIVSRTFDFVFSISSIEHSGISTYEADYKPERIKVFEAMYNLADKYLLVTCPFGVEMLIPQQYANVTAEDLKAFEKVIGQKIDATFYFRADSEAEFSEISYEEACKVEFDKNIGVPRCLAVLKVIK